MNARKAAMSSRLLRLLRAMRSLKVPRSLCSMISVVGDGHGLPLGALGLEVLTLRKAHGAGEDHGREALYLGVVGLDGIVVVLPGEGDLVLRRGELLLEVDEDRVRAEVRVVLGHREQVA